MAEAPVYTTTETPVRDPNLFLLFDANRPFIERASDTMTVEHAPGDSTLAAMLGIGAVVILLGTVLMGLSNLPSDYNILTFAVIAGGGVGGFVALLRYLYRDENVKGWIIPGVVTHAEKIRVMEGRYTRDYLGIRYQFAAPGGVVMEGDAEGESASSSLGMAPAPGTPVKIWLDDDGTHYLL